MSVYLSAAHKSSGKTVVSLGICGAISQRNLIVQPFKKGPDYIDPIWLSQASDKSCYNLDFYNMTETEIIELYGSKNSLADISLIEGNKGLYDGMSVAGGDANADLAKLLNIPVVLVIDTIGITRGVAPLVKGYQNFDTDVNIAGVILNKVAGERHESKLIQAIEYYTDIKVIGSVRRSKELIIDERHLGLMPANETPQSQAFINTASHIIEDQVNLDQILNFENSKSKAKKEVINIVNTKLTVAIAKDASFGFYYQDDIDQFKKLGVKISYFDSLKDQQLPKCDGLFIGGGFPEMQLDKLSGNVSLLKDIKTKIERGLPTYAECGGLMYLTNQIITKQGSYSMVGVIDADTRMTPKPIGRGYVQLAPLDDHPWRGVAEHIKAHEFHYSKLENISVNTRYAFKVLRGVGVDNKRDGIVKYNLLASYTHLRNLAGNQWVTQFVDFIKTKSKTS
ncbi:Protein similar to cobyrinic acid a,c-diamide synthetase clustered with dissimilatory sulfite reductase [uncultured Gammaproteobacteria bacterium]|nr:Protein similar to cobyrinic acid a,c-diamide synthetase clustered with dissimilatory sulfite reductase [uncultured Gammaproteobacteria bacterium]CAC9960497.1 Protein similar to cobyrinic acid a,c-diamide synthetase clustered with dissimilatory sulfite reductase [uncultured Gammaproteobacteria bacterium]